MKKRKVMTKERDTSTIIYSSERVRVSKELNGELFFEIENELTSDISEAIAIAISKNIKDENFWSMKYEIDINNVSPDKALYWLSGGDSEWIIRNNYLISWSETYLIFQEEFGMTIINSINKSKTFGDIKRNFIKKVNLSTIYEFSLDKGFIK